MSGGERLRSLVVFGVLAFAAAAVLLRLGELQLVGPTALAATRKGPPLETTELLAPRGRILDRNGVPLAYDRPLYELRVEVRAFAGLPTAAGEDSDDAVIAQTSRRLVGDLVWALAKDDERYAAAADRDALRARLDMRVATAVRQAQRAGRDVIDILVDRELDDAGALSALRALDDRRAVAGQDRGRGYRIFVHATRHYERVYADPDAVCQVVGRLRDGRLDRESEDGRSVVVDDRIAVFGLERLAMLEPRGKGEQRRMRDARRHALWVDGDQPPESGAELHTTIDRVLQVRADAELERVVEGVVARYEGPPEWATMVLIDVATGGISAIGSYAAAQDGSRFRGGAMAASQRLFPPGSVVKPLHLAFAYERGLVQPDESSDCRPGYQAGSEQLGGRTARTIRDSHPQGMLSPAGVIIRSSNIGAVRLGLRLGAEGMQDYLEFCRFGERTGVSLPAELRGSRPAPIPSLSRREQFVYSGPSILFGYQMQVTALQVARAFLSFLSGRARELRLVRGVEIDGIWHENDVDPRGPLVLSARSLDFVKDAMVGVVEHEHGTAHRVGTWLRSLRAQGRPELEIAGKTGTSEYDGRGTTWDGKPFNGPIRTSSFVGFTPVREPRYLVVCVIQKAGAGSFYGGTYAALAASRLLVAALDRDLEGSTPPASRSGLSVVTSGAEPSRSGSNERR